MMLFNSPELAQLRAQMRFLEEAHDRLFGPIKAAMATLPESEPMPTLDDIAAALRPQRPDITINIFINQEAENND